MRLTSIASGSSGNCIYVGSDEANILVDAGISGKRIENGLKELSVDPKSLDAILVTHEHIDHIAGLGVMARRYHLPLYMTEKTAEAVLHTKSVGKIDTDLFEMIRPNRPFKIKDMSIDATSIWHDAADPVCYSIESKGVKASVATDLGNYYEGIVEKTKDSDILFVEANHDINMLQVGPYPYYLKQRILSNRGHLSNDRSAQFLADIISKNTREVFLGHLSKENNYAELAYETVKLSLQEQGIFSGFKMQVAKRDEVSELAFIE
ncbi:MAG: MBL fold metallo-hydrolase [Lachnospiraceae bacterium]|nr:MBL fold metallo-hydrolase [Lachnospiraceae bacterium]